MEIKSTIKALVRLYLCGWLVFCSLMVQAQEPQMIYTVKNGKMYIELGRRITDASLDSFISRYELHDLALKRFLRINDADSLLKAGWEIHINNETGFIISKPLIATGDLHDPVSKMIFMQKQDDHKVLFPAVNNGIRFGYNRFENKHPFLLRDSTVRFFLRGLNGADHVFLAGSFNSWNPAALPMKRTDSGWIADLVIGPGKYWYKFIVNGQWRTDPDNRNRENDGAGNINSVYFRPNVVFTLNGFPEVRRVFLAGSFNNWSPRELPMIRTGDSWQLPVYLADGTHTYRFVVDGKWMADPLNKDRLPNEFGDFNSVIRIGEPVVFRLDGFEQAQRVELVGSFNNWKENELLLEKKAKGWELVYTLGPGNYQYKFKVDGKWITDPASPSSGANSFLVLQPNYTFRLKGFSGAREVFIAGDFNNWEPNSLRMRKENGEWVFRLHLFAGKVRYKFIVDGKWLLDPGNKLWEQNEYGTGNSIIWIEN